MAESSKASQAYNAGSISVLEGLDPVRKRPGMYIGSTSVKGLNHLIYEIFDNSVDEHLAGYCKNITVTLGADGSATIEDDGRGIPVDLHEKGYPAERIIMTTLHAGGKFDNNNYKTSGGLHGVGSSVVNALSTKMCVYVKRGGNIYMDEYSRGEPTLHLEKGELLPIVGKGKGTGTKITFYPDETIFDTVKFKADSIRERLRESAFLNPELTVIFRNERDGASEEIFHEPGGLSGFVDSLVSLSPDSKRLSETVSVSGEKDGIIVNLAFCYTEAQGENVVSFCNNINTMEGGTHVVAFKSAYAKLLNQYARDMGYGKDKKGKEKKEGQALYSGNETRNGMIAVISLSHPSPRFAGQTKTKLDNSDVNGPINSVVSTKLTHFFDRNFDTLKMILDRAEQASKAASTVNVTIGDKKFAFEGNGKLARQESNDPEKCEIFIVEGKSAGGTAKTGRDRSFQAILPIRGKILNVEKQSVDKILANEEIKAIVNALGCGFSQGYGNDFDLSKLKYSKIIIAADADVDGGHISTLLLTLFYRFMPELIYAGKLYRAMPPLYRVKPKKGKEEYIYDDKALAAYRSVHGNNFDIQRYKGLGEMDSAQLWETTMNPRTRKLKQISMQDALDANRLTSVLMGEEVAPRREYIVTNADKANLDV